MRPFLKAGREKRGGNIVSLKYTSRESRQAHMKDRMVKASWAEERGGGINADDGEGNKGGEHY